MSFHLLARVNAIAGLFLILFGLLLSEVQAQESSNSLVFTPGKNQIVWNGLVINNERLNSLDRDRLEKFAQFLKAHPRPESQQELGSWLKLVALNLPSVLLSLQVVEAPNYPGLLEELPFSPDLPSQYSYSREEALFPFLFLKSAYKMIFPKNPLDSGLRPFQPESASIPLNPLMLSLVEAVPLASGHVLTKGLVSHILIHLFEAPEEAYQLPELGEDGRPKVSVRDIRLKIADEIGRGYWLQVNSNSFAEAVQRWAYDPDSAIAARIIKGIANGVRLNGVFGARKLEHQKLSLSLMTELKNCIGIQLDPGQKEWVSAALYYLAEARKFDFIPKEKRRELDKIRRRLMEEGSVPPAWIQHSRAYCEQLLKGSNIKDDVEFNGDYFAYKRASHDTAR